MKEKATEGNVKIKVNQDDSMCLEEDRSPEVEEIAEDKGLEKMTKKELIEKIGELEEKAEKNYDLYLRSKAEVENIIKRNKKDREDWIKYSNENFVKEILPVIDNLEKAVSYSQEGKSLNGLKEGVELTLKGLKDSLTKLGLEEVKTDGEAFDPCYHHAVSEQADEEVEAGMILSELQKGYTLNQRLIRPAMVILSKGKNNGENSLEEASNRVCEE